MRRQRAALPNFVNALCTVAAMALVGFASPAFAQAPGSVRIGVAPLISPASANAYYAQTWLPPADLVRLTATPNEVTELARALRNDPDLIYGYVRNTIDTTWIYGLQRGALGALIDRSGTAFDQAKLMVDLLLASGHSSARYVRGTLTLTGAQFASWSGITNANAACQLLSSGAIPAIIDTASIAGSTGETRADCNYGGEAITAITLGHVWVSVSIGGTTYFFDPAYKARTFNAGVANLNTAAGLTSGAPLTSATSGMTASTDAGTGVGYVRNLNTEALTSNLSAYASNLQTYIQNDLASGDMEDFVGGRDIVRSDAVVRQTSYGDAGGVTWTSVPDQYRTTLRVDFEKPRQGGGTDLVIDAALFVDEVYGRRLIIDTNFDRDEPGITEITSLVARLRLLNADGVGVDIDTFTSADGPTFREGTITLAVNHPYAASASGSGTNGDYMDRATTRPATLVMPVVIVHGWGDVSPALIEAFGTQIDGAMPEVPNPGCENCNRTFFSALGNSRREQMGVSWLAQSVRAAQLHAEIADAIFTHHVSIGIVNADVRIQPININPESPIGPANPIRYAVEDSFDRLDVDMAFSLTSTTANATDRRAAVHAIAATSEALQGSVAAQIADLADTTSTATRFDWGNRPPSGEDPSGGAGARRFYAFNASNDVHAGTLAEFEGANASTGLDGVHRPGEPEIGDSERVVWRARLATAVSTYADTGFEVIASEESFLGPGQRAAAYELDHIDVVGDPWFTHDPSSQRGGALVATRYVGGEPVEIAHVTVGYVLSMKGGGGGAQASHQATYDPSTAADVLRSRFVDRSEAVGVDLQTGSPTYASPASLRVGNGGFPYELSASLIWRGGQQESERFGPISHVAPTAPWTTNWNNTLTISGSGLEAMGQSDVRGAASTVAAFLAMQDIYRQPVSSQREVAAVLAAAWWARGLSGNVVTVNVGADTRQFLRNTTGWFSPGASAYATLAQNGSRNVVANQPCGPWSINDPGYAYTRGWNYTGVSFTVTNANGDAQSFPYWANDYSVPGETTCAHLHGWRMSQWTFPRGVTINLVYQNDGLLTLDRLAEVNNNLGRRIVFSNSGLSGFNNGLASGSPDYRAVTVSRTGDITTHTDPIGAQTRIDHEIVNERHLLNEVFDADDTTLPSLRYVYDTLYRVMEAFDAEALQDASVPREAYEFRIAPNARGERADPATPTNGRFTILYDEDRRPFRFIDELGRVTSAQYDGRGRATRYIYPELDEERLTYDARNRVTQLSRCAKSGCNVSTDIAINATWNDTWNRPATITDARGYRTDFAYVASGLGAGELLSATRPASSGGTPIGSGARPVYSFGYGAFGRPASATDPTGLVTSSVINATTGNITSTTLNPGGVNAVTGFTYDAQGDVATTTDPRGNVVSASYDAMRRPTLTRYHNGNGAAALLGAQRTSYNLLGQVTSVEQGAEFSGTEVTGWATSETRTYTPTGQVATVANGAGNVTTNAYDGLDRLLSVTDPVGRVTRNEYDAAGQLTRVMRAFGTALQQDYARYTYSPNGQRLSVRDANDNRSVYVYDGFDRLCRLYFPVQTISANQANTGGVAESALSCASAGTSPDYEGYGYDVSGNRTSLRLRSGETLAYSFDNLNRETLRDIPGGTGADVYSAYDAAGRRLSARFVSAAGQGVVYAYDTAGRLISEQSTIGAARTLSYQYDLASNRTRVTWPDAFYAQYTYDALNRVDLVQENGTTLLADYLYDEQGRRVSVTRGNGAVSSFGYDNASRLTSLGQDLAGTADDQAYGFAYTPASQIAQRTASNDNYAWSTPAANRSYTRNGLNQYISTTGTGAASFTYDGRGNLTSDGSRTFVYDLENRLTSVSGAASATLAYDPLGRLRQVAANSTTTDMLYDGDQLSVEYVGANIARRYVHGPGVDEPLVWYEDAGTTDRRYLITDNQGSVIAANGATTTRYSYGPFGEPNAWAGSRFRYTGQIALSDIALYHYKARVYDPVLGRFLQTDPVGYEDDLNLYQYVGNDPLNRSDPTGRQTRYENMLMQRDMPRMSPEAVATAETAVTTALSAVPGVGDAIGVAEFAQRPTVGGAVGIVAGLAPGGDAARPAIREGVDAAVEGGQRIFRFGTSPESAARLERGAAAAEARGFPHGVSGSTRDLGPDASSASRADLEANGFPVTQTGSDPNHVTIEVPNPVTPEDAQRFNQCFGRCER